MTPVNPILGPGKLPSLKAIGDRLSRPKTAADTAANIPDSSDAAIPADHALVPFQSSLLPVPADEDTETISAALAAQAGYARGHYVNLLI